MTTFHLSAALRARFARVKHVDSVAILAQQCQNALKLLRPHLYLQRGYGLRRLAVMLASAHAAEQRQTSATVHGRG